MEKDALVAGVREEGARPFDLADKIDDGDLTVSHGLHENQCADLDAPNR